MKNYLLGIFFPSRFSTNPLLESRSLLLEAQNSKTDEPTDQKHKNLLLLLLLLLLSLSLSRKAQIPTHPDLDNQEAFVIFFLP